MATEGMAWLPVGWHPRSARSECLQQIGIVVLRLSLAKTENVSDHQDKRQGTNSKANERRMRLLPSLSSPAWVWTIALLTG